MDSMNSIVYSKRNFLVSVGFLILTIGFISAFTIDVVKSETADEPHYLGPVFCSQCHKTEYMNWNNTAHAHAYDDPKFQSTWKAQGSPKACLECHTTGFDIQTGTFSMEQVTCEMCHGPGGDMNLNTSADFCGKCHSYSHKPTYTDWLKSSHSHEGVECVSCHDPMSYNMIEEPLKLCGQCHSDIVTELEDGTHGASGYTCLNCHMTKSIKSIDGTVYNQTGHTFIPSPPSPDCKSCHPVLEDSHSMWGDGTDTCLTCHNPVAMTQLHLLDGKNIPVTESSILCQQCHSETYYEWTMGIHGDPHGEKNCIDCHKAMHWYVMMNATLPPMKTPVSTSAPPGGGIYVNTGEFENINNGTILIIAFVIVAILGLFIIIRKI